jgi:hypothetical protein
LFPDPIAQTKASKRQWTASTLKGKHQPKKDYPDGISPCAKRNSLFPSNLMFVKGYRSARDGRQKRRKRKNQSRLSDRLFLFFDFLIEREERKEKNKAGFF